MPGSLLQDRFAAEAVARIDHDFLVMGMRRDAMIGLAMRAYTLDGWVREFIAAPRGATMLHLGCGGLQLRNEQWIYEENDGRQWARYTWPARVAVWLMRRVAPLRRLGRLLRYRY